MPYTFAFTVLFIICAGAYSSDSIEFQQFAVSHEQESILSDLNLYGYAIDPSTMTVADNTNIIDGSSPTTVPTAENEEILDDEYFQDRFTNIDDPAAEVVSNTDTMDLRINNVSSLEGGLLYNNFYNFLNKYDNRVSGIKYGASNLHTRENINVDRRELLVCNDCEFIL